METVVIFFVSLFIVAGLISILAGSTSNRYDSDSIWERNLRERKEEEREELNQYFAMKREESEKYS